MADAVKQSSVLSFVSGCEATRGGLEGKASACNLGDWGLIPESGRSPGRENGNPLQYSCLVNPMNGGSAKSDMIERVHFHRQLIAMPFGSL